MDQEVSDRKIDEMLKIATKPSLENLAYCLRHPETWPKGFHWDFNYYSSCAMGLAIKLFFPGDEEWKSAVDITDGGLSETSIIAKKFAVPFTDAQKIFLHGSRPLGPFNIPTPYERITPEMVAKKIERFLAKQT